MSERPTSTFQRCLSLLEQYLEGIASFRELEAGLMGQQMLEPNGEYWTDAEVTFLGEVQERLDWTSDSSLSVEERELGWWTESEFRGWLATVVRKWKDT